MKLINAELVLAMLEAFKDKKYGDPHFMNGIATVRELIEDMPEAVVRCKDCQYRESSFCTCSHRDTDQFFYPEVNPDDYCSYGKRREA